MEQRTGNGGRTFIAPPPPANRLGPGPKPSFSVAIAAYQVAPYIRDAVRSALEQTYPPLEVIVCDDGSTDDIDGALAPYLDRIRLIRQENRGVGAAKDVATRAATADFVSLLDGDDLYEPERLEALAEMAVARPDLDILASDAYILVGDERVRRIYEGRWTFDVDDQRRTILERCFIHGGAAIRRDRLMAVGGIDASLRTVDDWDLWIRLILAGSRAGLVLEPLAVYRVREGSLSTFRADLFRGSVQALERAATRGDLDSRDRRILKQSIRSWRGELAVIEARDALMDDHRQIRRRMLRLGLTPRMPFRSRMKVLASAVAPGMASKVLAEREAQFWIGAANQRVLRAP